MAPPVLNPMAAHAARDKLPRKTAVWRQLEKKLDDEANAQAEEKKQRALRALEKQQDEKAKYEKAKAEALGLCVYIYMHSAVN